MRRNWDLRFRVAFNPSSGVPAWLGRLTKRTSAVAEKKGLHTVRIIGTFLAVRAPRSRAFNQLCAKTAGPFHVCLFFKYSREYDRGFSYVAPCACCVNLYVCTKWLYLYHCITLSVFSCLFRFLISNQNLTLITVYQDFTTSITTPAEKNIFDNYVSTLSHSCHCVRGVSRRMWFSRDRHGHGHGIFILATRDRDSPSCWLFGARSRSRLRRWRSVAPACVGAERRKPEGHGHGHGHGVFILATSSKGKWAAGQSGLPRYGHGHGAKMNIPWPWPWP